MTNPYIIPLSWRNMVLVFCSGLALWLLPWLAWPLRTPAMVSEATRKPPIFRYVKGVQGLERSTWSPVLIPLPTPDGFSKKAAVKEEPHKSLGSVLKPRISDPMYLVLEPPVKSCGANQSLAPLGLQAFDPERVTAPVFGGDLESVDNGIQIQIPEALKARKFEAPSLSTVPVAGVDLSSISITAYVELDRRGWVQHVLLEQPCGVSNVDAAVVRILRVGKGQPADGPASGHVKLFYWKRD